MQGVYALSNWNINTFFDKSKNLVFSELLSYLWAIPSCYNCQSRRDDKIIDTEKRKWLTPKGVIYNPFKQQTKPT